MVIKSKLKISYYDKEHYYNQVYSFKGLKNFQLKFLQLKNQLIFLILFAILKNKTNFNVLIIYSYAYTVLLSAYILRIFDILTQKLSFKVFTWLVTSQDENNLKLVVNRFID